MVSLLVLHCVAFCLSSDFPVTVNGRILSSIPDRQSPTHHFSIHPQRFVRNVGGKGKLQGAEKQTTGCRKKKTTGCRKNKVQCLEKSKLQGVEKTNYSVEKSKLQGVE